MGEIMMGRKKLTKQQIKDKAAAAAKRITLGKVNKLIGAAGGAIDATLVSMETDTLDKLPVRVIQNYSGINIETGDITIENAARGLGGPVFNKIERAIFKGLGVPSPSLRRKGLKSKIGAATYYGASAANAWGGTTNLDRFRRYYHSQYGVDLNKFGMEALDYSKPITEKIVPYVAVTKLMQWAMK